MDPESLYFKLPVFAQNAVCSLHGWRIQRSRFGVGFRHELRLAEERYSWSHHRFIEFRDACVSELIRVTYENVPYYRRLFERLGARAEEIRGLDDLQRLPILTKAEVQAYCGEMQSEAVAKRQRIGIHTSGTTGGGLKFPTTFSATHKQWATWWRFRRLHGLEEGTWCGYFGGRSIVPPAQTAPPYWRYNTGGRQIMFSAYHLSPATIDCYLRELRRRRPSWLHGYPSQLAMLGGFLRDRRADLGYVPRWITTGAENLMPQQVKLITESFGVAPIQHYGMAEAVANFSQCTKGRLHVDEDFAATEFVPTDDGSAWRVVGTNFTNPATPLIRYDVGDVVDLSDEQCDCGLPGRVVRRVDGRKEDYVLLRNGVRIGRMDHIFKDMMAIREAQIYQNIPGVIVVRVVKNPGYTESDERNLIAEFRKRVGDAAEIRVDPVNEIPRTAAGKLRFVVSDIREARLDASATSN